MGLVSMIVGMCCLCVEYDGRLWTESAPIVDCRRVIDPIVERCRKSDQSQSQSLTGCGEGLLR